MALSYMHGKNILHRDLKLENLMIQKVRFPDSKDVEVVVKITDFGFACELDPAKGEKLSLGSPMYTAPEVIKQIPYDSRCDVWSLGVMTYMMLTGRAPFVGTSKSEIYKRSVNYEPDYEPLRKYNPHAADFVKKCLTKDFTKRPRINELLDHPWLAAMVNKAHISDLEHVQIGYNMMQFKRASVFQSSVIAFMTGLFQQDEEIQRLNKMFDHMDKNKDGFICIHEIQSCTHHVDDFSRLLGKELNWAAII